MGDTNTGRARGLMDGIAVGNLLGSMVEGWPAALIAVSRPDGVREIEPSAGYPDDDDLALSIAIALAALAGPLDVEDLGLRFWEWAETNGLGIGRLTRDVLTRHGGVSPRCDGREHLPPRPARRPKGVSILRASKSAWNGDRASNGALMRCAPLAVRWSDDPKRLVRESVISAVPTHWDTRCGWSCAIALLTLQALLISLWNADDFESGLTAVVERGGDTDTNGAAAGAILGARFGLAGIPDRWRA